MDAAGIVDKLFEEETGLSRYQRPGDLPTIWKEGAPIRERGVEDDTENQPEPAKTRKSKSKIKAKPKPKPKPKPVPALPAKPRARRARKLLAQKEKETLTMDEMLDYI